MNPSACDGIALAEAWVRIQAAVLELAPELAREANGHGANDWRAVPAGERAVILAAAVKNVDPQVPSTRRDIRAELHRNSESGADRVSEAAPGANGQTGRVRADWMVAVESAEFATQLERATGAVAAVAAVRKALKGVPESVAIRFLALLGYPIVAPDVARMRWLTRFRLTGAGGGEAAKRREALSLFESLARELSVDSRTFDRVLGFFAGADGAGGWCLKSPRCRECPVSELCPTSQSARAAGIEQVAPPASTLAAMMVPSERPREKLLARGSKSLGEAELIAILLRTGGRGKNAVALANEIVGHFESLDRLARASVKELSGIKGVGPVKVATLKAAMELASRLASGDVRPAEPLVSSRQVFESVRRDFISQLQESFVALLLDSKHRLMRKVSVSSGTLNQAIVHPRDAFSEAVRDKAAAVIFVHNHPSGDPTPSRDDIVVTERLVKVGEMLNIPVLDHVVTGRDTYYSFADAGLLAPRT